MRGPSASLPSPDDGQRRFRADITNPKVETGLCLTDGRQCSRWVLLTISAADTRKVSGLDTFRNQAKSSRHFKGHFAKRHFQVRILATQPTSPVSLGHVRQAKISATFPRVSG